VHTQLRWAPCCILFNIIFLIIFMVSPLSNTIRGHQTPFDLFAAGDAIQARF
jgi:hypothetical protein